MFIYNATIQGEYLLVPGSGAYDGCSDAARLCLQDRTTDESAVDTSSSVFVDKLLFISSKGQQLPLLASGLGWWRTSCVVYQLPLVGW